MNAGAPFHQLTIVTVALVGLSSSQTALAQSASAWTEETHAAARLVAGAPLKSGDAVSLRAGLEIRLDPGWKTYWRYPGDSGLPPTFDFAGSENVKTVAVLWPAPERFPDGAGGNSIGYIGDVVLPLRITPTNSAKPVSLHLKISYAICGKLCFPAEADLSITLPGQRGPEEASLVAAEARVPRRIPLGANTATAHNLAIRTVHREDDETHKRVVVEVAAPEGVPVDLIVEGPTPDWALPLPVPVTPAPGSAPGVRRFTFDLDGLPPGANADGAMLTFTAVSPGDAIEVGARLD